MTLAQLRWHGIGGELHIVELQAARSPLTIGRAVPEPLRIDDGLVSRRHARLEFVDVGWDLFDLASTHGTFLKREGTPLRRITHLGLVHDDCVTLGETVLHYVYPDGANEARSTALGAGDAVPPVLTRRQEQVLHALCRPERDGRPSITNAGLAQLLHITRGTVRDHLQDLYERLAVLDVPESERRAALVRRGLALGYGAPPPG